MGRSKLAMVRLMAELEDAWRSGESGYRAARMISIAPATSYKYFRRFAAEGVPRGAKKPRKPRRGRWRGVPVYDGPAWIGKPIERQRANVR